METQLLRNPEILPSEEVLQDALKNSFPAYNELIKAITSNTLGLMPEWHYYNDGKAWLCKVVFKKKTIFWLSVWEQYFKIVFYFTEKHCEGIASLPIDEVIKEQFSKSKPIGKLLPLIINITDGSQLNDAFKIIEFKKSLK